MLTDRTENHEIAREIVRFLVYPTWIIKAPEAS